MLFVGLDSHLEEADNDFCSEGVRFDDDCFKELSGTEGVDPL